jgi:hypothetical protein
MRNSAPGDFHGGRNALRFPARRDVPKPDRPMPNAAAQGVPTLEQRPGSRIRYQAPRPLTFRTAPTSSCRPSAQAPGGRLRSASATLPAAVPGHDVKRLVLAPPCPILTPLGPSPAMTARPRLHRRAPRLPGTGRPDLRRGRQDPMHQNAPQPPATGRADPRRGRQDPIHQNAPAPPATGRADPRRGRQDPMHQNPPALPATARPDLRRGRQDPMHQNAQVPPATGQTDLRHGRQDPMHQNAPQPPATGRADPRRGRQDPMHQNAPGIM